MDAWSLRRFVQSNFPEVEATLNELTWLNHTQASWAALQIRHTASANVEGAVCWALALMRVLVNAGTFVQACATSITDNFN